MENEDMFDNIEQCCQLHEHVEIIYMIDGYEANLWIQDGSRCVISLKRKTILAAMQALDSEIKMRALKLHEVRKLPSCESFREMGEHRG